MKSLVSLFALICAVGFALWGIVWFMGSDNPIVPGGYYGYITQTPILGPSRFVGVIKGPGGPGRLWNPHTVLVSITPYNYNEDFAGPTAVIAKDNLTLDSFSMHTSLRIKDSAEQVKIFVEQYSTVHPGESADQVVYGAYQNYIEQPLRSAARDAAQRNDGLKIKDNIPIIGNEVETKIKALCKDTPFQIDNIVVGNTTYPSQITESVAKKLAATQDLARQETLIQIAEKEATIREKTATGIANANNTIKQSLTGEYLQYLAIEAQEKSMSSPNHTVIYIPVGPMGIPITAQTRPEEVGNKEATAK